MKSPLVTLGLAAGAAIAVAGCSTYDNYGRHGYNTVSVGYGSRAAYPYYGWYGGYYYPGTGYYVYDRSGSRHRWNDSSRRYWENRRGDRRVRENWSGYGRDRHDNGRRNGRRR